MSEEGGLPSAEQDTTLGQVTTSSAFPLQTLFELDGPKPPDILPTGGRFSILEKIGHGGMGEVFSARDGETGEIVALKMLTHTHPLLRYRFKREFRALADVEHPNLVRLGELVVPEQGPSFFTMELVAGKPFTTAVRGSTPAGQLPDLARLESALGQLLVGLDCLHANHCVHRDLKPSNVLITEAGRVVILDFGIISELDGDKSTGETGNVVGTPNYMAPEQAAGARAQPATDLYAVGVMLYECLTGRVPFQGSALQVLVDKQTAATPDPRDSVPEIPARLRDMCLLLLQREPARRPSIAEVLGRLEPGATPLPRQARKRDSVRFIGRTRELALLERALLDVREQRQLVVAHVRGSSGVGKSALVRQFLLESGAVILRGRCRERETVPYKGIDAAVDALAVHVRRLPESARKALCPRYADALTKVFPVFDQIWARDETSQFDPHEARGFGWAALRELLTRIAEQRPLIMWIDDFQWTDQDTVALLRMLARQPDAPEMLLLVSARNEVVSEWVRAWFNAEDVRETRWIELSALPAPDARELALVLLRAHHDPAGPIAAGLASRADAIALRCAGSPFFISQTVLAGESIESSPDLDQIVVDRLARLSGPARRLLDIVAVAGRPVLPALVLAVAGDESKESDLDELRRQGLLVRGESEVDLIETTHDRIRERSLAELTPERWASLHWALAERLWERAGTSPGGDALFEIVDHLDASLASDDRMLEDERRLELAQLFRMAGDRALGSAAWASARRYFELGYQQIGPELRQVSSSRSSDARDERRALVLAIAFGRAQAEMMTESELADVAFDELFGWELSVVERGQFAARRVALLLSLNRLAEAVRLGLDQLARLGHVLSANPSRIRAMLEILRGWWTLGRQDVEVLLAVPEMRDSLIRARLDILVETTNAALYINPPLSLTLAGHSIGIIHRHGYHVGLVRLLTQLAVGISAIGRHRTGAALCDRALALADHRTARDLDAINARVIAQVVVWPPSRPLRNLLVDVDQMFREICDVGLEFEANYVAVPSAFYMVEIGKPLPEIVAFLDRCDVRTPHFGGPVLDHGATILRRHIGMLVAGETPMSQDELASAISLWRYAGIIIEVAGAVMFGDYAQATERMDAMPSDYEEVLIGIIQIPRFSMFSAMLEARRCPKRGLARIRTLRKIRRHVRVVQHWAKSGPENFGPIAAMSEGEWELVRGRVDRATDAFERARSGALQSGASYLVALACLRLAAVARDRGQAFIADAAYDQALAVYESWGAIAVAARLRELGLARI